MAFAALSPAAQWCSLFPSPLSRAAPGTPHSTSLQNLDLSGHLVQGLAFTVHPGLDDPVFQHSRRRFPFSGRQDPLSLVPESRLDLNSMSLQFLRNGEQLAGFAAQPRCVAHNQHVELAGLGHLKGSLQLGSTPPGAASTTSILSQFGHDL